MFPAPRRILATNSPFRRFWFGFTFSVLGDAFTRVAFTWFVYETTKSAAVGLLMVFYTGPLIVGGFLAGWALDRFDGRVVMIADNVVRGLAIAIVPLLYLLGSLALSSPLALGRENRRALACHDPSRPGGQAQAVPVRRSTPNRGRKLQLTLGLCRLGVP